MPIGALTTPEEEMQPQKYGAGWRARQPGPPSQSGPVMPPGSQYGPPLSGQGAPQSGPVMPPGSQYGPPLSEQGAPVERPVDTALDTTPPSEVDPKVGQDVARDSLQAAFTATGKEAKELADEVANLVGGDKGLEEAYEEAMKRLGGEKQFNVRKLTREEKGLFLVDFGMRLMAASETQSLGGAVGTAGMGTLGEYRGMRSEEQDRFDKSQETQGALAMDFAKDSMKQQAASTLADAKADEIVKTVNTKDGLYNVTRDGKWVKAEGEGGAALEETVPINKRGFARQYEIDKMIAAGFPASIATEIGAGAKTDSEIRTSAMDYWIVILTHGDEVVSPVTGKKKRPRNFSGEELSAFIAMYWNFIRYGTADTSSLNRDNPALGGKDQPLPEGIPEQGDMSDEDYQELITLMRRKQARADK